MDVGGGGGGEGSALKYMYNVQARPQTFTRSQVLRLTGKKLTLRFIVSILLIGHHPPYVHLVFFVLFRFHVLY